MIYIKRPSKAPSELKGTRTKPSLGEQERTTVIQFYSTKSNVNKAFKFKAYKSKAVIEALNQLFNGKCAYCESKYQATAPVDVEHYRPKGGVNVTDLSTKSVKKANPSGTPTLKLQKPGYYWLAAQWQNLLPSCIDCNRERNQRVPDCNDPLKFVTMKVGKGNNFPLVDERKRRLTPSSRKREEPLILDPTIEKYPNKHLEFTKEGLVRPALTNRTKSARGAASINVYGLQRTGLVLERRARAKMVLAQIERVHELIRDFKQRPGSKVLQRRLTKEMAILKEYSARNQEYAGMARQLTARFFRSL